jgi:4-diphosphocytidyl-2-C-methyl-D-erythritol kinase
LTNTGTESNLRVCRQRAERLDLRHSELINDFEPSVFDIAPSIRFVKEKLIDYGAVKALLCGSGASVFGIFENDETRQTAMRCLASETDWKLFAVATISRKEFRDALSACEKLLPRFD